MLSTALAIFSPDFSPVAAFTKKYLMNTLGLPALGAPYLASYLAFRLMAVATGVIGSSKAAALL